MSTPPNTQCPACKEWYPLGWAITSHLRACCPPLVCVCPVPDPEWVYVAHQCATCKRLIQETAS